MKYLLEVMRPVGDDSVPVHGVMPSKMKELEDLTDNAYSPCCGVAWGFLLGTCLWGLIGLLVWWLCRDSRVRPEISDT